MLTNLWYVVLPSSQLTDGLKPVRLLGQPFVAFRDDLGVAHLLSDVCVHRGGSLSAGIKVGNSVQCPYHGWRFGPDGTCTLIPRSQTCEFRRRPGSMRTQHWNVMVGSGLFWVISPRRNVPLYLHSTGSTILPSAQLPAILTGRPVGIELSKMASISRTHLLYMAQPSVIRIIPRLIHSMSKAICGVAVRKCSCAGRYAKVC